MAAAQQRPQPAPLVSTEGHPGRTVTFRLSAPKANEVAATASGVAGSKPQPMQRDEKGVWSATVGPLDPEIYSYMFSVDSARVADPNNPNIKLGVPSPSSVVEVPAEKPQFYDPQLKPHGTVHINL